MESDYPESGPFIRYPTFSAYLEDLIFIMFGHLIITFMVLGLTSLLGYVLIVEPMLPGMIREANAILGFFAGIYLWFFVLVLYYLFIISLMNLEKMLGREIQPFEVRIPTLMDLLIFV